MEADHLIFEIMELFESQGIWFNLSKVSPDKLLVMASPAQDVRFEVHVSRDGTIEYEQYKLQKKFQTTEIEALAKAIKDFNGTVSKSPTTGKL